MEFSDRQITCLDCGQPFVFTAGEQEFYERKGFREEPKRCKTCRETRKQRRGSQMPDAYSGDGGGGEDAGNRAPREARRGGGGGGGGGSAREMFEAVCAQCGAPARVPFKPAAGRPVYCRDCYAARVG